MNQVILFDDDCRFCDLSVQFIIKRDKKAYYQFAALQSDIGQEIARKHDIETVDSFLLIDHDKCFAKSSAAFRVCRHLSGLWKIGYAFLIIPRPIRDFIYEFIAKNRYRWFGKKTKCIIPPPHIRKRFL